MLMLTYIYQDSAICQVIPNLFTACPADDQWKHLLNYQWSYTYMQL